MILGVYIAISAYGPSEGESVFTYFPYIIMGVLFLNLLTGVGFTIVWLVVESKAAVN